MKKAKRKTGGAASRSKASAAAGYPWANGVANGWRWLVDDRMRDYGEINYVRRVIRINRAMHKRDGELLIDTLFPIRSETNRCRRPRRNGWRCCS